MSMSKAKDLRHEAGQLFEQAKAIRAEYEGKEMPADKLAEVDELLDTCEAKVAQAQSLEREAKLDGYFSDPVDEPLDTKAPDANFTVKFDGRELGLREIKEMEQIVRWPAYLDNGTGIYQDYAKAFERWLRKGVAGLDVDEHKALAVGDGPTGGYLVQDTFLGQLIEKAREVSVMRQIATVLPMVPSGSVITPTEENMLSDAEWTSELDTGADDTVEPFGRRRLTPKPLAKRIRVSNTFLRVPTFDVEGYVRDRMAYKFAVPEERAFISGAGDAQQPMGLLSAAAGLPRYTTLAAGVIDGDDIINWIYGLNGAYARSPKAVILCNRSFIRKVRQMKDGNGNYIWQPGLQVGSPNTILDRRYVDSDLFPTGLDANDAWTSGADVAVWGDFAHYWIVDALGMEMQRLVELYAESNQTGYIGRKECDGAPVLNEAFSVLRVQ